MGKALLRLPLQRLVVDILHLAYLRTAFLWRPQTLKPGQKIMTPRTSAWLSNGGYAICDQGLFAGANFLVNVALARLLLPAEYGAFAVAFSVFLFIASFHSALLTEPMLVYGSGKHAQKFRTYFDLLLQGHIGLGIVICLILGSIALFFWQAGSGLLATTFLGLSLAAPCITFLWFIRHSFYVQLQPHWAAVGGGLYLTFMIISLYGLYRKTWLSPASALLLMGGGSLVVGGLGVTLFRSLWRTGEGGLPLREVLVDHWSYGRWLALSKILKWVPTQIYYTLLSVQIGLEDSAALRAAMNLLMPILHVNAALSTTLVPQLVKMLQKHDAPGFQKFTLFALSLFTVGAFIYWCLIFFFSDAVISFLYDGRYAGHVNLFLLLGFLPVLSGIGSVLDSILRATRRPKQIVYSYAVSCVITLTLGWWLLASQGVLGAGAGMLASSASTTAMMTWFYTRERG